MFTGRTGEKQPAPLQEVRGGGEQGNATEEAGVNELEAAYIAMQEEVSAINELASWCQPIKAMLSLRQAADEQARNVNDHIILCHHGLTPQQAELALLLTPERRTELIERLAQGENPARLAWLYGVEE